MRAFFLTTALAVVLSAGGCSDPKAANEANFRKALEPAVHDRFCGGVYAERLAVPPEDGTEAWPVRVPLQALKGMGDFDKAARALLEQGARDGLLTRKVQVISAKRVGTFGGPPAVQPVISYTPTSKGSEVFRPAGGDPSKNRKPHAAVCAAKAEIVDVVRWTNPGDMFGQTVTLVTYHVQGTDVYASAPTDLRKGVDQPREETTALVRTSDGWRLP